MFELNADEWDVFLSQYPDAHLLQTSAWGELKSAFGWKVSRFVFNDCGAQILFRPLPTGRCIAYIPKGPVGNLTDRFWMEIDGLCLNRKAILLKVEPDLLRDSQGTFDAPPSGFRLASQSIQPVRTIIVDLSRDEKGILESMKQKTRYNVRLALKRGIVVHPSADLERFYALLQATAKRDRFGVHNLEYYQRVYDLFHPRGECELFQADYNKEPIAGIMVFLHGRRAWYFYGASAEKYREYMPTYLLQWEAMRWARAQGCCEYDLWGVPDAEEDFLEANFTFREDGLWGVYRFKRGFGGELRRSVGPWDKVYNLFLFTLYQYWSGRQARV
jgi:lipid II:glycine glycyltransferase (peptidoglycan interpeptide bridge formation enzyme)